MCVPDTAQLLNFRLSTLVVSLTGIFTDRSSTDSHFDYNSALRDAFWTAHEDGARLSAVVHNALLANRQPLPQPPNGDSSIHFSISQLHTSLPRFQEHSFFPCVYAFYSL